MNFWQQHIVNEQGFEATKFTLVIADSYSELLSDSMADGNRVDIIQLNDNFKDALNTDESSFKVKELSLSVDELSCQNAVNTNCLSFLLECKKRSNTRYVALYETKGSTAISFDNMLFLGKLDTKVTGDDIVWNTNSIYTHDIKAKRFYKFNALEFSVAVLDECSINKEIRDETGTKINNIYERTSRAEIEALENSYKFGEYTDYNDDIVVVNYHNLINLYDLIQLVLTKSTQLLNDLLGINVTFELEESNLGIKGLPVNFAGVNVTYDSFGASFPPISSIALNNAELSKAQTLYITDDLAKNPLLVHKAIFDPSMLHVADLELKYLDLTPEESARKSQISNELPYSFRTKQNVSTLLFDIARSFGVHLITTFEIISGVLNIKLKFVSLQELNDTTVIYPIGATDGSLDTSGESKDSPTEYFAEINNFLAVDDEVDVFDEDKISTDSTYEFVKEFGKSYNAQKLYQENVNKLTKTEFKRISFTSGIAIVNHQNSRINRFPTSTFLNLQIRRASPFSQKLTTQIFQRTAYGGAEKHVRPIQSILWKDNGTNKNTSLVEYVNSITANNREYYKTEYTLTVPYYSAFAIKDGSGEIISIGSENLKIGRTIRIKERKKAFVTGSWVDYSEDVDFKIVEIEKNLTTPEVKLKLQSISSFAYGVYDGDGSEILGEASKDLTLTSSAGLVGNSFLYYEIDATSDDILNGDRVVITENQKLIKAKAHSDHYGLDFGFAKNSGVSGDFIPVDTGEISFCNDYTLTPLDVVFVRTGSDTTSNISQTGISDITGGENLYYKIGTALSPTVIKVETEQYEFE